MKAAEIESLAREVRDLWRQAKAPDLIPDPYGGRIHVTVDQVELVSEAREAMREKGKELIEKIERLYDLIGEKWLEMAEFAIKLQPLATTQYLSIGYDMLDGYVHHNLLKHRVLISKRFT